MKMPKISLNLILVTAVLLVAVSLVIILKIIPPEEKAELQISDVNIEPVDIDSARISWTTNKETWGSVSYTNNDFWVLRVDCTSLTNADNCINKSHSITLYNLKPDKNYSFDIFAKSYNRILGFIGAEMLDKNVSFKMPKI